MVWPFRRSRPTQSNDEAWWREADLAALDPSAAAVDRLQSRRADGDRSADDLEQQDEMLEGLREVLALSQNGALPVLETQHRVIGGDTCHFVTPASLAGQVDTPGKLFLTAQRLVFAGARVLAWPWHRIRQVDRAGRVLVITVSGAEPIEIQCNSYGEAVMAAYLARRLKNK